MAAPDARALANRLAALDDAALARLLAVRGLAPTGTWSDFYDLADALLDPVQLARGLVGVSRAQADALETAISASSTVPAGALRDDLAARALVDEDGTPYAAVAAAWPQGGSPAGPAPESLASEPPAPGSSLPAPAPESDAHAAERAFTASASLADIVQLTVASPLTRIGAGVLGATDRRRLVEAGAASDEAAADELIAIAELAGLVAGEEREWLATAAGLTWLDTGTVPRWHTIALRLRAALPAALRTERGGWIAPGEWPGAYPFDPAWPARAARLRTLFARWGLFAPDGAPAGWAAGLAEGGDADLEALQALLPPEVDRVYLQNDLTAIAPGPLEPQLDMRLRAMARRESRAQASTYRFTAETLGAALTAGETAQTLREFLTALSLTGLPQPLAYEIERSAARHGTIRVGPDWTTRTRVTSDDVPLLQAILVDQALRPLGFVPDGGGLVSRSSPDTTFWMLADARYPVVAVDAEGNPRHVQRHRIAAPPASVVEPGAAYATLIARLRSSHESDADAAWMGRELEHAVRAHSVVTIVVRLPDGGERELTMEATGLGGGRLRGRDRAADVERTLPLSSIVSVRSA